MGCGCTATVELVYVEEHSTQLAAKAWKMNVIGTTKCNHCRPDAALAKSERAKMKRGTYECIFFPQNVAALCCSLGRQ
jgi:hypothetical protein